MSMPDVLARAFPNMGAAQGWQSAFQSVQGREAGVEDVRNKMAGDAFAAKFGRGPTDEEWTARYYSKTGAFEGMQAEESSLDKMFGPSGTLATKLDEQKKAEAENSKKLLEAFNRAGDKTYTVVLAGTRITD
jgi:Skp family chaperone for outer membrane proteins